MRDIHSLERGHARSALPPSVLATMGEAAQRSRWPKPLSMSDWVLVPEAIGVAARVAIWSGMFCLLLVGLFTYPAAVVGAFVLIVLLARYFRRRHP